MAAIGRSGPLHHMSGAVPPDNLLPADIFERQAATAQTERSNRRICKIECNRLSGIKSNRAIFLDRGGSNRPIERNEPFATRKDKNKKATPTC